MKTGTADLPLHGGKAPRWLFSRMVRLSREITKAILWNWGSQEFLRKLSDPFWFQSFGCLLGFDWHSSGLTTTACGALKEGLKGIEKDLGIYVAGGKGRVSRGTPDEIRLKSPQPEPLVYASRMSAKVDSAAVQDGYQLYQHTFVFTPEGKWAVIQQGMNEATRYARRYHWLGEKVEDFVVEPHSGICGEKKEKDVMNLVSKESARTREISAEISRLRPETVLKEVGRLQALKMPAYHEVLLKDISGRHLKKVFLSTYEKQPINFEKLLGIEGVGPKTIRALALLSELIYGAKPSFEDPVRYSFAHGGKDGFPFPVDRKVYENTITFMQNAVSSAKLGNSDKFEAMKRIERIMQ